MFSRLLICLCVGLMATKVHSAITVAKEDFTIDCGTDVGGAVTITYTNANPINNKVHKIYSPNNKATCQTGGTSGVFAITDARTNCNMSRVSDKEYAIRIQVQEVPDIRRKIDPLFIFTCKKTLNIVELTTTIVDGGQLSNTPIFVVKEIFGDPDMTYEMKFINTSTLNPLTAVKFGDDVMLQVKMLGTDADEQGVQVETCDVKSGGVTLRIIENFCVVEDKKPLFQLSGFVSSADSATLRFQAFGLEGSTSSKVDFECTIKVCSAPCPGRNCATTRRRRAAGDKNESAAEEKSVKISTRLQVVPIGVSLDGQSQTGGNGAGSASCMQSMGFMITVAILAVLLIVAMAAVIFMFTTRRREMQKPGA